MSLTTSYVAIEARRVAIPLGVIDYNQSRVNPYTDRRSDCSGLISYVWDLPTDATGTWLHAYTTQSLWEQGLIQEIDRDELQPGDAIGFCGSGTANGGGGHIALYQGRDGDRIHVWDHGSGMGPKDRWVNWSGGSTGWLGPDRCKAWRYVHISNGPSTREDDMALIIEDRDNHGHYYVLGADGVARRLVLASGNGINDVGWVASGRYFEENQQPRPKLPYANEPIDEAPWVRIPVVPVSVLDLAGSPGVE